MPKLVRKKSASTVDSTASDSEAPDSLESRMDAIAEAPDAKDNIVHTDEKEIRKALLDQIKIDNHIMKVADKLEKEKENIAPNPNMERFQQKILEKITMPVFMSVEKMGGRLGMKLDGYAEICQNDKFLQDMINEMIGAYGSNWMNVAPIQYRLPIYMLILAGQVHINNSKKQVAENHIESKTTDTTNSTPIQLPDSFEDI